MGPGSLPMHKPRLRAQPYQGIRPSIDQVAIAQSTTIHKFLVESSLSIL